MIRIGWNANILPVDTGIDIVAHRAGESGDAEIAQCQVKTTLRGTYQATMDSERLRSIWQDAINLVVVFWDTVNRPESIVIPPRLLHMLTSGNFQDPKAPLDLRKDKATLKIFRAGGRFFVRNRANEITLMRDRFDLIEPTYVDVNALPEYAIWSDRDGTLLEIDFLE